jgi:hypothetical protein
MIFVDPKTITSKHDIHDWFFFTKVVAYAIYIQIKVVMYAISNCLCHV